MAKRKTPRVKQLTEEEAWEIALNDHPEYREGIVDGTLPEEILDAGGEPMNPRLHVMMHMMIEMQLSLDDPKGVAEIGRQLAALGVSRHEIRHAIATALAEQLWMMQAQSAVFDEEEYLAQLRDVVDGHRRPVVE